MDDSNKTKTPPGECSHWRELALIGSLSTLNHIIEKVQHKIQQLLAERGLICKENPSKRTDCPKRVDCFHCFCLMCNYHACVCTEEIQRKHLHETGHMIGYCCRAPTCYFLFCFKCDSFVDDVGTLKADGTPFSLRRMKNKLGIKDTGFKNFLADINDQLSISKKFPTVYCRGLFNFGPTCYMNCIIQVLIHIPMISDFFGEIQRNLSAQKRTINADGDVRFMTVFQNLLQEFQTNKSEPICPSDLLCFVWEKMPHVGGNRQHDAHEFFISAINTLHQEFIKSVGISCNGPIKSLIDKVFLGRMQSELTCNDCGHSRYTDDPFMDASLEVISDQPRGTTIELCDLLERFTRLEHLEDSPMPHCPICSRKTKSTKQITFKALPPVICIQLKRFRHNSRGGSFTKIKTKVSYPEILDLSPYKCKQSHEYEGNKTFLDPKKRLNFRTKDDDLYYLYAIVSHSGTYGSGHYRTFLRKRSYWFAFDDCVVQRVSQKEVLESEGYLLFYSKVHPLS